MFTSHGHFIYGSPHTPHEERPVVVGCGGPENCNICAVEAEAYGPGLLGSPTPPQTPVEVESSIPSSRALVQKLYSALESIEEQIKVVQYEAERLHIDPELLQTPDGSWVMVGLLVAQASVLSALTSLGER